MDAAGVEEEKERSVGNGQLVRCVSLLDQGLGRHVTAVKLEAQVAATARMTLIYLFVRILSGILGAKTHEAAAAGSCDSRGALPPLQGPSCHASTQ